MALIADIVAAIMGSPAPVLFLDTCIFLDVVRAPIRNKASEVEHAQLVLKCVQRVPPSLHLLVPSPVRTEWTNNLQSGFNDSVLGVTACDSVATICRLLGLPPVAALPERVLEMPRMLQGLSEDLLAASQTIDHDALAMSRAIDRIVANAHPVKPDSGKGAKDAVIFEHAVETISHLRNRAFAEICIFVSSNTKDFADPTSTRLHPKLTAAFGPVDLRYAVSLTDAIGTLTGAGWIP